LIQRHRLRLGIKQGLDWDLSDPKVLLSGDWDGFLIAEKGQILKGYPKLVRVNSHIEQIPN